MRRITPQVSTRITALITVSILALAACGGGSDDAADTTVVADTAAPVESEAPAETEAPAATTAPADTAAPADTTVANPAPASGAVAVSLVEWAVEMPVTLPAGTVTFDVFNNGNFPHHFAVARGDSYETLPQTGGGAIDEATLGADFIGRTDNLQSGENATIEFDLEPGNYVFFCNIAGSVSHAAQGQVLAVTVE